MDFNEFVWKSALPLFTAGMYRAGPGRVTNQTGPGNWKPPRKSEVSVSGSAAYAHMMIPLQRGFKKRKKIEVSVSGAVYSNNRLSVSGGK